MLVTNSGSVVCIGVGNERSGAAASALSGVIPTLERLVSRSSRIVIKPNLVDTGVEAACADVCVTRALFDSCQAMSEKKVRIAEGSATGDTFEGFSRFGYTELSRELGVELVDLNSDEHRSLRIFDCDRSPITVRASKTMLDSDLRISVTPAKTHDTVILTLSIKNCVVGSLVGEDKKSIHQGYPMINLNIALLAKSLYPHFSLLDAFAPMEGDGPVDGSCTKRGMAFAGDDPLAVDSTAARALGFDPSTIGYLAYCERIGLGNLREERISLAGEGSSEPPRPLIPHSSISRQLRWETDQDFIDRALGTR